MKLVKTTTHHDTVVLTNREFDGLHEPGSQLTVIISQKIGDVYQSIDKIEKVDLEYALQNWKEGYGYYEGKKIVSIRPLQRKSRTPKRFCKRGHDTNVVGRHPVSGACNECARLHSNVSNQKKRLETARKKLLVPFELQGLNADVPQE